MMMQETTRMEGLQRPSPPQPRPPPPPPLSIYSSYAVQDSAWAGSDVQLGAGMVLFQQDTHMVVVINDTRQNVWLLPKGRKNISEPLEQTALREAFEEASLIWFRFRCFFLFDV